MRTGFFYRRDSIWRLRIIQVNGKWLICYSIFSYFLPPIATVFGIFGTDFCPKISLYESENSKQIDTPKGGVSICLVFADSKSIFFGAKIGHENTENSRDRRQKIREKAKHQISHFPFT